MPRLRRAFVLLMLSVVSVLALVTACTSAPSTSPTQPETASVSPSSASSPSASSSSARPSASTPPAKADTIVVNITISNRQVSPNGGKINVTRGQTVVLNVTSDADDEIHAHTAGDGYELEVKAGVPTSGRFVASDSGSFEVESHHLDKIIAILVVR